MAHRNIIENEDGTTLEYYVNTDNELCISIHPFDDLYSGQFISFDKYDLSIFIKDLQNLQKKVE